MGSNQLLNFFIYFIISLFYIPAYIIFATGTGLYCGAKFKNQATAVIGFVIFALIFYILNFIVSRIIITIFVRMSPNLSSFGGIFYSILRSAIPITMYAVTGIILKRKTIKNLRKNIF